MASSPEHEARRRALRPDFIGRYEIIGELGGGGMASVFLGRVSGPGGFERLFAVKRLHEHLSGDEAFVHMFLNEARIAGRMHHPNIVSVYDVGEDRGRYFIAMDYLRGETLSFVLNRAWKGGPGVPYHLLTYLMSTACDALHSAHELRADTGELLGVIHRDLSPRNMMLGYDGLLRILDFGVAKAQDAIPTTRTGTQKGTVAYMAPEQILGRVLDRRVDIFALGTVLWESTVGKRLWASHNDFATAAKVRQAQVPPPSTVRPDYPVALERIVLKALRRNPDERYQTARELGDALRVFLSGGPRILAATDAADFMQRLCADRLKQRIEMERAGLRNRKFERSASDDSIKLDIAAGLAPERPDTVDEARGRTELTEAVVSPDSTAREELPAGLQRGREESTIEEASLHDMPRTVQSQVDLPAQMGDYESTEDTMRAHQRRDVSTARQTRAPAPDELHPDHATVSEDSRSSKAVIMDLEIRGAEQTESESERWALAPEDLLASDVHQIRSGELISSEPATNETGQEAGASRHSSSILSQIHRAVAGQDRQANGAATDRGEFEFEDTDDTAERPASVPDQPKSRLFSRVPLPSDSAPEQTYPPGVEEQLGLPRAPSTGGLRLWGLTPSKSQRLPASQPNLSTEIMRDRLLAAQRSHTGPTPRPEDLVPWADSSAQRSQPQTWQSSAVLPKRRSAKILLAILAVLAAVVGFATPRLWSLGGKWGSADKPLAEASSIDGALSGKTPEPGDRPQVISRPKVELTFRVRPTDAQIEIDGRPHRGILTVPTSTRSYEVRVSAAGFVSRALRVQPNKSKELLIELEAEPAKQGGKRKSSGR